MSPRSGSLALGRTLTSDTSDQLDAETVKKLEKTSDVRFLMPAHMPSYLRIDKDVKESLITLATLTKQYSSFDVLALEREVSRTLELELDR